MRVQGSKLSGPDRRAIAEYLGGAALGGDPTGAATGRCASKSRFSLAAGPAWNGWGGDVRNTRHQSAAASGLTAGQVAKLELKWAFGFPDATSAWAPPTVVGGRVFVGSQNGTVYSLDAKTGCIDWFFSADGGVRTAIDIGPRAGGRAAVYFGDTAAKAYALDAETGQLLWKTKVETHPLARITGSPTLFGGRLYVPMSSYEESQGASPDYGCCTFRGSVSALDTKTGKVIWRTYMIADAPKPRGVSSRGVTLYGPAGAPIWSTPTIDARRSLVYVGTGNTYAEPAQPTSDAVVALDLATGAIRWTKQLYPKDTFVSGCRPNSGNPNCAVEGGPDYDFGNAPILARLPGGKDAIVIGQKSGMGWALDPDRAGEILWQYRAGAGSALGGIEWGSSVDAEHAYFAVSDIFTPKPGGLHAVDLTTGQRVWFTPPPPLKCPAGAARCNGAQASAISVIDGVVFSGSNDGAMRAFSAKDGALIWEVDTNRDFTTVNGVKARGASMIGPGPVAAGGMLYVPSGYGAFGGRPGNVLLAFGVGG
jgi:polyvinyl alcohol dehydrogenase (cytochrome)